MTKQMTKTLYRLIKRAYVYHDARGFDAGAVITAIDNGWVTVDCIGQIFSTQKGIDAVKVWIKAGKPQSK